MRNESFVICAVLLCELVFLHFDMCESLVYYVITVFIISSKLDACSIMEYELQCGCCGPACFIGLFHSLSLSLLFLPLCLSASLAHRLKAGVYRNSRQAGPCHTAEQHRNVLYALERQGSWCKIVPQVPQTWPADVETYYIYYPVK